MFSAISGHVCNANMIRSLQFVKWSQIHNTFQHYPVCNQQHTCFSLSKFPNDVFLQQFSVTMAHNVFQDKIELFTFSLSCLGKAKKKQIIKLLTEIRTEGFLYFMKMIEHARFKTSIFPKHGRSNAIQNRAKCTQNFN